MTQFNPLRAAREELAGLDDINRVLNQREQKAMETLSQAESELNALRKILGYVRITRDILKKQITELETQQ
jgi:predicted  nucleic acid-binding Zn-ribbon protein